MCCPNVRQTPDERVAQWIDAQPDTSLFTTTVTQAEILYGVSVLPTGKRKEGLVAAVEAMFEQDFRGRTLPFDGRLLSHSRRSVQTAYVSVDPSASSTLR